MHDHRRKRHHHEEGRPEGPGRGHHPHHRGEGHERGGGPGRGGRRPGGPGGHGGPGGPGGRARRGEARYLLLDALRDSPKHGYEIIKALEERSSGQYAPSPGTVYPTLQFLEETGLVRSEQEAERRVYHLTEAGKAELEARAEELKAFWAWFTRPTPSAASQTELGFLQEELDVLSRTIWGGLHNAGNQEDIETIRRVRQAVETCRNEIRQILTETNNEPR